MNSLVILSERKAVARANTLRQWLELESARARTVTADQRLLYASVAEFVLHRGRAFETGRLGDAEGHGAQRIARWSRAEYNGFRFGQPFWNTRRALEFDVLDQFHYVEGFVLDGSETVPHPHAWLSAIANDAVVDFTGPCARKRRARKYSPMVLGDLSVRSYFGVALPHALVHAQGQTGTTTTQTAVPTKDTSPTPKAEDAASSLTSCDSASQPSWRSASGPMFRAA